MRSRLTSCHAVISLFLTCSVIDLFELTQSCILFIMVISHDNNNDDYYYRTEICGFSRLYEVLNQLLFCGCPWKIQTPTCLDLAWQGHNYAS